MGNRMKNKFSGEIHFKYSCSGYVFPTCALQHCKEYFYFSFGATAPQWAMASPFTRFLDHTQRRTTIGRTPLDEWLARRRDFYLTIHNNHDRQTSVPPVGSFYYVLSTVTRIQRLIPHLFKHNSHCHLLEMSRSCKHEGFCRTVWD